jgi:putative acetyltransferase
MQPLFFLQRTSTDNNNFQLLIRLLDHELWHELNEDQATYDPYNKVPHIKTAVVLYVEEMPVACGCFKHWEATTVEIKRMYVKKEFRGKGFSKKVLQELETWAKELGYREAVLETSIHFDTAKKLYESSGYFVTTNYPPYEGLPESVCMRKRFLD